MMKVVFAALFLLSMGTAMAANRPAWCSRAGTDVERQICADPDLWQLEKELVETYRDALRYQSGWARETVKNSQRRWIENRNRECRGLGRRCIEQFYVARIAELQGMIDSGKASSQAGGDLSHELKNMTYRIDGQSYTLHHGSYEDSEQNSVTFGGILAQGDVDGDGTEDFVVELVVNNGGSGEFYNLAVVLNRRGKLRALGNTALLGDRIKIRSVRVKNGRIIVKMIEQGPDDPMCCPHMRSTHLFKIHGNRIVEVR